MCMCVRVCAYVHVLGMCICTCCAYEHVQVYMCGVCYTCCRCTYVVCTSVHATHVFVGCACFIIPSLPDRSQLLRYTCSVKRS